MKNPQQLIRDRVREIRKSQKLSQRALAKRAQISPATYIHFERTGEISLARLIRVLIVMGREEDLYKFLNDKPLPRTAASAIAENVSIGIS